MNVKQSNMTTLIKKAESYSRSLKGTSEAYKESKLYEKYGGALGIETISRIVKTF